MKLSPFQLSQLLLLLVRLKPLPELEFLTSTLQSIELKLEYSRELQSSQQPYPHPEIELGH